MDDEGASERVEERDERDQSEEERGPAGPGREEVMEGQDEGEDAQVEGFLVGEHGLRARRPPEQRNPESDKVGRSEVMPGLGEPA